MSAAELPADAIEVMVAVDDEHMAALDQVASALVNAGLRDHQVLPATGAITGRVDDAQALESLRRVEGVAAADVVRTIQIPPPEEPVQ